MEDRAKYQGGRREHPFVGIPCPQVPTPHPPLDVAPEEFTLGNVHTVPSHSQTQLVQVSRGIGAPAGCKGDREGGGGQKEGRNTGSVPDLLLFEMPDI